MKSRVLSIALLSSCLVALTGCPEDKGGKSGPTSTSTAESSAAAPTASASAAKKVELPKAPPLGEDPPFFPPIPAPENNTLTPEKVMLGKMLFFDKRLGKDGKWSCESCHYQEKGWTDGKQFSEKANGKTNGRHSPTLYNVAYANEWYWDGRKATLEAQILAAWTGQMGGDTAAVSKKLTAIPEYDAHFQRAFGGSANEERIVQALASFVRTLRAGPTPWDKYEKGDKEAVGEDAVRGQKLFVEKANCSKCHAPPLYSDYKYHNVGIGFGEDVEEPDMGRGKVTEKPEDMGAFKTPSLRGVALHPPYFHDGSAASLEEAVDYMLSGGNANEHLAEELKKVTLTDEEKADLVAFLKALTPETKVQKPKLP
jgi:cytochrome c peroxidase